MQFTPMTFPERRSCIRRRRCGGFAMAKTFPQQNIFTAARIWTASAAVPERIFADVDLLVTPTTRIPAPAIADLKKDPEALRPAEITLLRNTRPFNVWGLPAISLPCGFTKSGLPIGLQIAGPPWREDLVLRLAHAYEQATAWHKRNARVEQPGSDHLNPLSAHHRAASARTYSSPSPSSRTGLRGARFSAACRRGT